MTDALVMERLASRHPNILQVHGYCGASVLVEAVPHEVQPYVVLGSGYYHSAGALDGGGGGGAPPAGNGLGPRERLAAALEMAESLAVLHGHGGGAVAHGDVQLSQWLRRRDGRLVLGDFHSSHILNWDGKGRRYCPYSTGTVFGNVRRRLSFGEEPPVREKTQPSAPQPFLPPSSSQYRSPEEYSSSLLSEKVRQTNKRSAFAVR
jgi:serine/threonine protein kinase